MNWTKRLLLSAWMLALATILLAPLAAQTPAATRFLGTVTAINGSSITVKTDAGESHPVDVPPTAVLKQIAPGEKDLSKAEVLDFAALATGDRVLVKLDASQSTPTALQIIAIKQAELAKKQQADREDWQKRGVGGLVKSVDPATGVIVIASGSKTITLQTTKKSILKRYAPASIRFDLAQVAPISVIQPGDQLRARGDKSADGSQLTVEEAVSGSFRNIAGTVTSFDVAAGTLTVKDLSTKKSVTIKCTPESQLHKLPDSMATRLAAMLKSGGQPAGAPPQGAAPTGGPRGGFGGPRSGMGGAPDPQMILSHAPSVQLADLKKGDAVMLVATQGATDLTAVTLMAGVEALLEAPAASNLLSNWSMGGGDMGGGQ